MRAGRKFHKKSVLLPLNYFLMITHKDTLEFWLREEKSISMTHPVVHFPDFKWPAVQKGNEVYYMLERIHMTNCFKKRIICLGKLLLLKTLIILIEIF